MGLTALLPEPIKKTLRPVKRSLIDQRIRCSHLIRCFQGKDIWVRTQISCKKVRLGRDDGEWCLCPSSLTAGGLVYSFGVGRDISFDLDLIDQFGVEVHAFDPTPIATEWIARQQTPPNFHFHPFGVAANDGVAHFSLPLQHAISFTMLPDVPGKRDAEGQVHRLETIFNKLGHQKVQILKLDIEGAEYDLIPDIVSQAERIDQLLIEFHHRLLPGSAALNRTREALQMLFEVGFRLYYVSPRGLEYCFLRG